ncbi:Efg1 protein [Martiniozyma asiatica (nom. inval.)]|nr:Efg1 protein [Martiniozyma asiatica]
MARRDISQNSVNLSQTHSVSAIKKKMRDIKRLLTKDLPLEVRIANERALKSLEINLSEKQEENKEKKVSKKYHMVRFFEKKKAVRRYNQAKKEVTTIESKQDGNSNADEVKELKKDLKKKRRILEHATIDLAYVLNFPRAEKYISLYTITAPDSTMSEREKKGIIATNETRDQWKKEFSEQLKNNTLQVTIEQGLTGGKVIKSKKDSREVDDVEQFTEEKVADDDFFE